MSRSITSAPTELGALEATADQLRRDVLGTCCNADSGRVGSSLSCVDILTALYFGGVLRYDPANPNWADRDRFVLSKGHAGPALYCALSRAGFFPADWLTRLSQDNGPFGSLTQHGVPGVEATAGSLGIGFGIAAGMALAARLQRENWLTWVLLGDAECYEGSVWEVAAVAAHQRLNNLVAIVDRNCMGATDWTENACALEPFADKWEAFGWNVEEAAGHDMEELLSAFTDMDTRFCDRPTVFICHTVKGFGVDFLTNAPLQHARIPKGDQELDARRQLGFPEPMQEGGGQ